MANTTMRASERAGIDVDVRAPALRDLMTEQSMVRDGWATFYTGTPAQFVAAGISMTQLPVEGKKRKLQINGLAATLERKGDFFELAIHWGLTSPAHNGAEHPALSELSRMMHIGICYWSDAGGIDGRSDEVPTDKLIACRQAVDYRLPPSKRFRFGPAVKRRIFDLQSQLYYVIREAEIYPLETAAATERSPKNVVPLRRKAR